ncbi:MAG: phytanoyl-CoA dioxygenase family protein [Actinomycetes bacterium]
MTAVVALGSSSGPPSTVDVPALEATLYRDGVVGLPGLFSPSWADALHEDFEAAFAFARSYPDGTIGRGPQRYYFAVHPERIRGFVDLVSHPVVAGLCAQVLGPDYLIVELGFDVPLPGAKNQPWHRDFRTPPETAQTGRLTSLAFNVTTVDVTPDLAPFEIAPGTQFDNGETFDHGMFPGPEHHARYQERASRRFPRRGDVSARTGLTIHRGTENFTDQSRAVLILGAVVGATDPAEIDVHGLVLTRRYHEALPEAVRSHLFCTVVDELTPIAQKHDIEGLMMGG